MPATDTQTIINPDGQSGLAAEIPRQRFWRRAGAAFLAVWCIAAVFLLFCIGYWDDEGFYSLVSRYVAHGSILYRDLRYTQMPLLPYLYGPLMRMLPQRIESGRFISLAMVTAALALVWSLMAKRYRHDAAFVGLTLIAFNIAFVEHMVRVMWPAPTFLTCVLALYFLSEYEQTAGGEPQATGHGGRPAKWALLGGLFAGAALLTRLSTIPLAVLAPLYCYVAGMRGGRRLALTSLGWCAIGAWAIPALVMGGFDTLARDQLWFDLYSYNTIMGYTWNPVDTFLNFSARMLYDGPLWALAMAAGVVTLAGVAAARKESVNASEPASSTRLGAFEVLVAAVWILILAIHATRRPSYGAYQIGMVWGPALAAAWATSRLALPLRTRVVPALLAAIVLFAVFTPNQQPLVMPVTERAGAPYAAAAPIRRLGSVTLITFDAGIAYCAPDAHLLPHYEMGWFALPPAGLPDEANEHYKGVSVRQILGDMDTADVAALRLVDFSFMRRGAIPQVLARCTEYHDALTIDNYGQFGTVVKVFVRRTLPVSTRLGHRR